MLTKFAGTYDWVEPSKPVQLAKVAES
jgi:hypothetical protein